MQNQSDASDAMKIMQGDPAEAQAAFVTKARSVFRDAAGELQALQLFSLFELALRVIATLSPTMQVTVAEAMQKNEIQVPPREGNARDVFAAKGRELCETRDLTDLQVVEMALLTTYVCAGLPPPPREGGELVDA